MPPSNARRTLQDIKTNAGRMTAPGSKQRLYLRLCTLEMERSRREQEYAFASQRAEAALRRVERLQSEIDEITREISPRDHHPLTDVSPDASGFVEHRYGAARKGRARKTIRQATEGSS